MKQLVIFCCAIALLSFKVDNQKSTNSIPATFKSNVSSKFLKKNTLPGAPIPIYGYSTGGTDWVLFGNVDTMEIVSACYYDNGTPVYASVVSGTFTFVDEHYVSVSATIYPNLSSIYYTVSGDLIYRF